LILLFLQCMLYIILIVHGLKNTQFRKTSISSPFCTCLCDKVYHKQEVRFLLNLLSQIVTWNLSPNPLDQNWPCTVINDNDWRLGSWIYEDWGLLNACKDHVSPVINDDIVVELACGYFDIDLSCFFVWCLCLRPDMACLGQNYISWQTWMFKE